MLIEAMNQAAQNIANAVQVFNGQSIQINEDLARYERELSPAKYGKKAKKLFQQSEINIANVAALIETDSEAIDRNAREFTDNTAKSIGMVGVFPVAGETQGPEKVFADLQAIATGAGEMGIKLASIAASIGKYPQTATIAAAHTKIVEASEKLIKLSGYIETTVVDLQSEDED